MNSKLDIEARKQLFSEARTYNSWNGEPISDEALEELYELAKWGPTAANSNPARFVFVRSPEGKARLIKHLSPGNVEKTQSASVCVIVALDSEFYEFMPQLFPSRDMKATFIAKPDLIEETGTRSSILQGAYLMLAARSLGYDVGPMSGFDNASLDADFFPDGRWKSNFLINLGRGTPEGLFERNPRLQFDQACRLV
tara:strand:- start:1924 stop:2514 length:591 start_codon:yes stop_codon:yes gene_type:complete